MQTLKKVASFALVVFTVGYFFWVPDAVNDLLPVVGRLDDVMAIVIALYAAYKQLPIRA